MIGKKRWTGLFLMTVMAIAILLTAGAKEVQAESRDKGNFVIDLTEGKMIIEDPDEIKALMGFMNASMSDGDLKHDLSGFVPPLFSWKIDVNNDGDNIFDVEMIPTSKQIAIKNFFPFFMLYMF